MLHVHALLLALVLVCIAHRPLYAIGCSYRVVQRTPLVAAPTFFVCTHDYQHVDLFVVQRESYRWRRETGRPTVIVVADRLHNYIYDACAPKQATCMMVRGGTTQRMLAHLHHDNVCIFLYRGVRSAGCHHVLSAFDGPCVLVRIRSAETAACAADHGHGACFVDSIGRSFEVQYRSYEHVDEPAADAMRRLHAALHEV